MVVYELVHEWIMGTDTDNARVRVRLYTGHGPQFVFCGVLCGAASAHTDRPPECCSFVKKTSTESWVV